MQTVAQKSLRTCSFYFCLLTGLLACLVGLGTENWGLALLVGVISGLGYLYTDRLEWFVLPRAVVIVLMIAGAALAVGQFLGDAGGERINAVGNLLIYVQVPLIFQKKSKRVFEQWGVFLLLELVVAALVNSDVLFGLLMIPILTVGVLAMMSLAAYCSLDLHNQSQAIRNDWWTKLLNLMGREKPESKQSTGIKLQAISSDLSRSPASTWGASGGQMGWGPMVLSLGVIVFTLIYFYMLPRMSVGAFEVSGWGGASIGISDQVSLRYRGTIKPNDAPVLRMQLVNLDNSSTYMAVQPPYVRMTVLTQYLDGPTRGVWLRGEATIYGDRRITEKPPVASQIIPELSKISDNVEVRILEKTNLRETIACLPPYSAATGRKSFRVNKFDWRMIDASDEMRLRSTKGSYSFLTYSYRNGIEKRVLPNLADVVEDERLSTLSFNPQGLYRRDEMTHFPASLTSILAYRDELLADSQKHPTDKLGRSLHLEQKLSYSPEFTYSLKQLPPQDPSLDPIADFLLNRKRGHCEYYASSFAMLLRSMNVPSRIVLGFRPVDYNELGGYYIVKQGHAHAWVEGYFSSEEIAAHPLLAKQLPTTVTSGAWVRFDPTPAGEGSNGGTLFRTEGGQAFTAIQDFWSEMIMNMDRSRQSAMLDVFGEASESSYLTLWEDFQNWVNEIRAHPFFKGLASPRNWFSWRAAVVIFTVGGLSLALYQAWIWFFPDWNIRNLSHRRRSHETQFPFYNRLMQAMRRLDLEPQIGQTPREFWNESAAFLKQHAIVINPDLIADSFYALRYGAVRDLRALGQGQEKLLEDQVHVLEGVSIQQLTSSGTSEA